MNDEQELWQVDGDLDALAEAEPTASDVPGLVTAEAIPTAFATSDAPTAFAGDAIPATLSQPTPPTPPPQRPRPSAESPPPPTTAEIVEALLFVGVTPLTAERACEVIRGLDPEQFRRIIDQLNRVFRRQNRPYTIQATEKGWVLVLRNPYRRLRERLVGSPRAVRLSGPAMDVLAIVAYRQPINKRDIDTLRGQESGAVLRSLVRLGVVSVGQRGDGSSELCYRTTQRFLEVFGLRKLSDLPQSDDFSRL
jgi:segregation and condensation protein B